MRRIGNLFRSSWESGIWDARSLGSGGLARESAAVAPAGCSGSRTACGPLLCYLTNDGLDRTDPGEFIRLRGRVHAAARTAAEGCQTTYHATGSTMSIGIRGPDAADQINQLRQALAKLIAKHGWTIRDQPR